MRKVFRLSVRILLGVATLSVVGVLLLAWRLESRPIDLAELVPTAERALTPGDGTRVTIGKLSLVREGHALLLRAQEVLASDQDGVEIFSVPAARIYVSVGAFLSGGVLAPERILLEGVSLKATLHETGGVTIGQSDVAAAENPGQSEFNTSQLLTLWKQDERLRYLRQIGLEYGNISVAAPKHGFVWRAPNVSATITNSDAGLILRGDALMRQQMFEGKEIDRALGKVGWLVQAASPAENKPANVSVEVTLEQVDPTILAGIIPPLVGERGLEAPISGTLTSSFLAGEMPNSAAFALSLGSGQISIPNNGALAFNSVSLIGSVSLEQISVSLDQLVLDYGGQSAPNRLQLSGQAIRDPDGDILVAAEVDGIAPAWLASLSPAFGRLDGIDVVLSGKTQLDFDRLGRLRGGELNLAGKNAAINLPTVFETPVALAGLEADIQIHDFGAEWKLDALNLAFHDGASVQITGQAHRGNDSGTASLAITGTNIQVDTAKRFWPVLISPPARDWVVKNIISGKIPSLDVSMSASISGRGTPLDLSDFSVDARMPLRDLTLTYWDPLPGATEVSAEARITNSFFEATNLKGKTGGMDVTGGKILVSGIDKGKGHELLDLTIDAEGPIAELMVILDRKPLHFARFLKLQPAVLKGAVRGTMLLAFPPVADLELDDIKISASGTSHNAFLPGIAGGYDLSRTNVTFQVDKEGLRLKGKTQVAGVSANVSAHVPFADKAPYQGRYVVIGNLNNRDRAAFGLDSSVFQPPYFDGPAGIILTATQRSGGKTSLDMELDLNKASLSVAAVGWSKPAGGFAAGQVRIGIENGILKAVDSFKFSGPGMRVAGNVRFGKDRRPTVRLSSLKLGGGTDIQMAVRPLPKNGYEIELGKGRLDLRPMILANNQEPDGTERKPSSASQDSAPLRIKLSGPSVRVRSGPPFHDMQGGLLLQGENILDAEVRGRPGGVGLAVFRLTPNGKLLVTSDDAGALLQTMGLPGKLEGGKLELKGTATADMSDIDADLRVSSFRLVEAPVMMRVLQLASITGPLELLAGSRGLQMTAIEAPFTLKSKSLEIKKGRIYGGSLGVTFRGSMDLAKQSLDFKGAVVPVYVLNRLLSSVPLVGDVLTGGEGIFAVSYSVAGSLNDPQVKVNPLSLLAPGGLRRLLLD